MGGSPKRKVPFEYKEGEHFGAQADALGLTPKIRDEELKAALFIIARIPTDFSHIGFPNVYRAVARLRDGRKVRIWYTFDGSIITLQGIDLYG